MSDDTSSDKNVEIWKVKKLIKSLQAARGNGTSMISLIIPPGDQVSRVTKMLADEYGTASNIKSRVNRLSLVSGEKLFLKHYRPGQPNWHTQYGILGFFLPLNFSVKSIFFILSSKNCHFDHMSNSEFHIFGYF